MDDCKDDSVCGSATAQSLRVDSLIAILSDCYSDSCQYTEEEICSEIWRYPDDFWDRVEEWKDVIDFDSFTPQTLLTIASGHDQSCISIAIQVAIYKLTNHPSDVYRNNLLEDLETILTTISRHASYQVQEYIIELCYCCTTVYTLEELGSVMSPTFIMLFDNAIETSNFQMISLILRILMWECDIAEDIFSEEGDLSDTCFLECDLQNSFERFEKLEEMDFSEEVVLDPATGEDEDLEDLFDTVYDRMKQICECL